MDNIEKVWDYASPAMKAEKALKDIHFGIIDGDPQKAKNGTVELLDRALELYDWVRVWDGQRQK